MPSRESFSRLVSSAATEDTGPIRHEPRGSRLDDWWGRLLSTPGRRRLWYWGGPVLITLLAAVLRLWNLGTPHALVFDETFYVKDAWTLLHHGYESSWPAEANTDFNAGRVNGFLTDPAYVVHPPLGKWLIALGLMVFGATDSFGWRISTAIIGILAVLVLTLVARKLFASTLLAVLAGFLFAIDGQAIVMSRVAILDNSLMFFALLGFAFILADRGWHESRLAARLAERRTSGSSSDWGPIIWWRPWLIAAGVAFGCAAGVKWSGFYFLAAFGLYLIVVDALVRRRLGLDAWFSAAILKQGPATFLLLVPVSLLVYLASWTGWFVTDNGYYRHWADQAGNAWTGAFAWVPSTWQSFVFYQQSIYSFHVGLSASHPYSANPLGWLALIRPTSMWYASPGAGVDGCAVEPCSQAITSIANPLIWWAAVAATLFLVYRLIRRREWQVGLILTAVAAGYLPWLMYTERTVFQFYTIAFLPYLILGLVFVLGRILGSRDDPNYERTRGISLVAVFLVLATAASVFWYPLWSATTVPFWFWSLHSWLTTWI